jgi:hypothetical protein
MEDLLAALIGAVVVGIYATAHKPKAKPAKPTTSAEVASPAPALR